MKHNAQLAQALQVVSAGAAAVQYAARAAHAVPGVFLPPGFTYNAVTAPLNALAGLLGLERLELPPVLDDAPAPPAKPVRARRRAKRRKARSHASPALLKTQTGRLPEPPDLGGLEGRLTAWDPDERPYSIDSDPLLESSSCRALLLEIVRRAAYDWVLYRQSSKLPNRLLAESAFQWLFQEERGCAAWVMRVRSGKELTGFVAICDLLELDVARVRDKIKQMTERDIMGAGRPAERRRHKHNSDDVMQADDLRVFDVDVDSLPSYDPMFASSMEG